MMTTAERITDALERMRSLTTEEARDVLDDINPTTVAVTLSKMTARGELVRKADGKYYLGNAANREDAPGAAPPVPKPKPPAAPPAAKAAQTIAAARVEKKPASVASLADLAGETKPPTSETKSPIGETKPPEVAAAELADETFGAALGEAEQEAWTRQSARIPTNIRLQETEPEEIDLPAIYLLEFGDPSPAAETEEPPRAGPELVVDVTLELPRATCTFHGELGEVLPLLQLLKGYRAHA